MTKDMVDFFKYWLGKTEHNMEIRVLPSGKQLFSRSIESDVIPFIAGAMDEDVYYGVCSRIGRDGTKNGTGECPALWVDLDSKDFPRGPKEAIQRLASFQFAPTIVVNSGHGYHAYWFFREPEDVRDPGVRSKIENILKGLASHLNGDMASAEIARILRAPGTKNRKDKNNPVDVTIEEWGEQEYNLSDFENYSQAAKTTTATSALPTRVTPEQINERCGFLQHAYQNPQLSEPLWFAMVSNLSRISPGGPSLCHTYSLGYPRYDRHETDAKILHALNGPGPHTCKYIRSQGFDCGKNCGVTAPISLFSTGRAHSSDRQQLVKKLDSVTPSTPFDEINEVIVQIAHINSESHRDMLAYRLSEKTGIQRRSIIKDIKACRENEGTGQDEEKTVVYSASFPGLIDICLDDTGDIAYLVRANSGHLSIEKEHVTDDTTHRPPSADYIPFDLAPSQEIMRWYETDTDATLFEDVMGYLRRFSYLEERQFVVLATTIFLSYIQDHKDIHYLAMIIFYSAPERGKSRTGKSMTYASFRGVHVVDMREANLFRFSQDLRATIFFDLMDMWKKAERSGTEDILLLRYEKGAKVSRVLYPDRGPFQDMRHFGVSGLTYIATNEPVHNILDTRAHNIAMPNRPGDYENPTPDKAVVLKARLTAWRARNIASVLPEVPGIPGINGRLWDISKPLLQICKMVCPQRYTELQGAILDIAGQRIEDKRSTVEGQIVAILDELSPGQPETEWTLATNDVLQKLNDGKPDRYKRTSQWLGRKLKGMGVRTRHVHGYSQVLMRRAEYETLCSQYGSSPETLPLSTHLSTVGAQGPSGGRDNRNTPPTLYHTGEPGCRDHQNLVDSGRDSVHGGEDIYGDDVIVCEPDDDVLDFQEGERWQS